LPLALASGQIQNYQAALAKSQKNLPIGFSLICAKAKRMIDFLILLG